MNILHLSDIHFGRNNPEYHIDGCFDQHDRILGDLIDSLQALEPEKRPEHIVVTGDIAWHGKEEEFKQAQEWFERLLSALDLTGKDISFCVGNHDVSWDFSPIKDVNDDSLKTIDELYKYENISQMELSIYNYDRFCDSLGVVPYTYPLDTYNGDSYSVGFKDIQGRDGKKIRLLSFNTSLLFSQPGISEDKMWLGQEQLKSLMEYGIVPAPEDIWYTIALFHHSDRFLNPYETSSYEGRMATLPLLMENVDLLLCGHTESIGKPRRLRQTGGGTMLCAGATYYSDTHNNIVSVLNISSEKHALSFTPIAFDGDKWSRQSLSYFTPEIAVEKSKVLGREGKILPDCELEFYADEQTKVIGIRNLEVSRFQRKGTKCIRIDDRAPMNYFTIFYDGPADGSEALYFSYSPMWTDFVDSVIEYLDVKSFFDGHKGCANIGWRVKNAKGQVLISGNGFPKMEDYRFPKDFLLRLKGIEEHYHVRFCIPQSIEAEDWQKISILEGLIGNGYCESTPQEASQTCILDEVNLQELSTLSRTPGPFFLKGKAVYSLKLFGSTIHLGYLRFVSGPYTIEAEDLEKKVSTYQDGDQRTLSFLCTDSTRTRFYCDAEKYQQEISQAHYYLENHRVEIGL